MARPEVTGQKVEAGQSPSRSRTYAWRCRFPQFCDAHNISEGFFYKLKKQNRGSIRAR